MFFPNLKIYRLKQRWTHKQTETEKIRIVCIFHEATKWGHSKPYANNEMYSQFFVWKEKKKRLFDCFGVSGVYWLC